MSTPEAPPSPIRRLLPWLLAIGLGVGVGWVVGGLFGSDERAGAEAVQPGTQTPPAPPPVLPKGDGPAPSPAPVAGPPMTLTISNRNCNWGADYETYYQRAADMQRQIGSAEGREVEQLVVRVPNRSWNGLTVGGVAAQYEGAGIIFVEPVDIVRAVLERSGVTVAADGGIPLTGDAEGAVVQAIGATTGSTRRYGATMLSCGA